MKLYNGGDIKFVKFFGYILLFLFVCFYTFLLFYWTVVPMSEEIILEFGLDGFIGMVCVLISIGCIVAIGVITSGAEDNEKLNA